MGDHPLRSPTDRRLGGPLPRQLANRTHARPPPMNLCRPGDATRPAHAVLAPVSRGCPPAGGWLHTRYAPVRHCPGHCCPKPFDLHVLGLPLAFILSQDQTLHCKYHSRRAARCRTARHCRPAFRPGPLPKSPSAQRTCPPVCPGGLPQCLRNTCLKTNPGCFPLRGFSLPTPASNPPSANRDAKVTTCFQDARGIVKKNFRPGFPRNPEI